MRKRSPSLDTGDPVLRSGLLTVEEGIALDAPGRIDAAVLVALWNRPADGELMTLFTKRNSAMRKHAGEVSFPGGRQDQPDQDLSVTALREAHEEIGLDPDGVHLIGALTPTPTFVTNYSVYPFVGVIEPDAIWRPNESEVASVIEAPLSVLAAGYRRQRLLRGKGIPIRTDTYTIDEELIWGATARIVSDLLGRVQTHRESS